MVLKHPFRKKLRMPPPNKTPTPKRPIPKSFVVPQDDLTSNLLFNHRRPQNPSEATSKKESLGVREKNMAVYREILMTLRFEPTSLVSFVPRDLIDHYILPMCDEHC